MTKTSPATDRRHLVFTSAGDRANLQAWLTPDRTFDLWVTYYGDAAERYREMADFYAVRKGGKFPNLFHAYQTQPEIFQRYDAIMVMDDDVIISGNEIDRLFQLREELGLWLLQPAFSALGRISFPITRVNRACRLRYTTFIEMTCPLFQRDKLDGFMKVYDPVLVGYGCDWWFIDSLGEDIEGKVAVIDEVTCVNPWVITKKGGGREIDRLQSLQQRRAIWAEMVQKHHIRSVNRGMREYSAVRKRGLSLVAGHLLNLLQWLLLVKPMELYTNIKVRLKKTG